MTKDDAIKVLEMVEAHGLADEAKQMAMYALGNSIPIDWLRNLQDEYYEKSEWLLFTAVDSILDEWNEWNNESQEGTCSGN